MIIFMKEKRSNQRLLHRNVDEAATARWIRESYFTITLISEDADIPQDMLSAPDQLDPMVRLPIMLIVVAATAQIGFQRGKIQQTQEMTSRKTPLKGSKIASSMRMHVTRLAHNDDTETSIEKE